METRDKRLTIQELARLAQVSKGTVSKVLNGYRGISPATSERILKLAKELNFQPDASARALALQRTGVIGFLIPHREALTVSGHYWSGVLAGLSTAVAEAGMNLMVLTTAREGEVGPVIDGLIRQRSVDGLVIASDLLDSRHLSTLVLSAIPFVLLGRHPDFSHWSVDVESQGGTGALVDHLWSRGSRRIGSIMPAGPLPYALERTRAWEAALESRGQTPEALFHHDLYAPPEGSRAPAPAMVDFFLAQPDLDGLLVGAGGEFLLQVLAALEHARSLAPGHPRQPRVAVFDDYPWYDFIRVPVTAVRQPLAALGEACFQCLQTLLAGGVPPQRVTLLATELVVRGD